MCQGFSGVNLSLHTREAPGFEPQCVHHNINPSVRADLCYYDRYRQGLEGRAAQSNSPVDCCDRERPSRPGRRDRAPVAFSAESTLTGRFNFTIYNTVQKNARINRYGLKYYCCVLFRLNGHGGKSFEQPFEERNQFVKETGFCLDFNSACKVFSVRIFLNFLVTINDFYCQLFG